MTGGILGQVGIEVSPGGEGRERFCGACDELTSPDVAGFGRLDFVGLESCQCRRGDAVEPVFLVAVQAPTSRREARQGR